MHDIAEFLATVPPFDALGAEELEAIAARAEIEYVAAGGMVLPQGAPAGAGVRVVRRGAVEVVADGVTIDRLVEGEVFGYASLLGGRPHADGFRAGEDSLLYRLPNEAVRDLFEGPDGLRFVIRRLDTFDQRRRTAPRLDDPAQRPVASLLRREAVICAPSTTVQEAAKRATAAGGNAVVIPLEGGALGIVTDHDMRTRVVAAGRSLDTPLSEVMSHPAYTVQAGQLGSEVLLQMVDRGVRHFPVIAPTGEVLGVVSDIELLAVEHRTPFHLRAAIGRAATAEAVTAIVGRLRETAASMHRARIAPPTIAATLAAVLDAAIRRLLELAVEVEGPTPVPFAWLALGSHARRELVPSSDIDSAIVWLGEDEDKTMQAYTRRVATRVLDALTAAGVPPCEHGASAAAPAFARSLDSWLAAAASWQHDPHQEQALILSSVVVEARPVWGVREGAPMIEAFRDARNSPALLRGLARMALAHRPPTGFLRDIVVEHSGAHAGRFDIKNSGLLPVVDLARYAGLMAGVTSASTRDRLRAAAAAGTLPTTDAQTLEEAFDLLTALRLDHQVTQIDTGADPDDHLDPARLGRLTRSSLRDAFRAIAKIQRGIAGEVGLRLR